jgi:hypothetical protein
MQTLVGTAEDEAVGEDLLRTLRHHREALVRLFEAVEA